MSTDRIFRRQILRAAARIQEHLAGTGQIPSLPQLYEHDWTQLTRAIRHYELARQRGWRKAAASLVPELDYSALRLHRQLDDFKHQLPRSTDVDIASAAEIAADLLALQREFENLEVNLQDLTIRVQTPPLELEDVYLGPFQIVLFWEKIGRGRACYEIVAREPCPAADNSDVTHPHVSGERLCEGEGTASIRSALAQGRLLDFFTLVKQILETYNPASAYVMLSRWSGGEDCHDCGCSMQEDESWSCERCENNVCDDCRSTCEGCDQILCRGCSGSCAQCDGTFCRGCLNSRTPTDGRVCNSCLEKGDDSDEEAPADDPSAHDADDAQPGAACPAANALCLAEAAVPA